MAARSAGLGLGLGVALALVVVLAPARSSAAPQPRKPAPTAIVSLLSPGQIRVPAGFVGMSLEYPALATYAGPDPAHPDPVFVRLIRGLVPGQSPVIRVGGHSTDWTWWPVPDMPRPSGIVYDLTPRWLASARAVAAAAGAHYILGVNLEANSPIIATTEADALLAGIGRSAIAALEPGNEPELYAHQPWYRLSDGTPVAGRGSGYGFDAFLGEFDDLGDDQPGVPLAGPSSGNFWWLRNLKRFIVAEPSIGVVTLHSYWLDECLTSPALPGYPTVPHLLDPDPPSRAAQTMAHYARIAHAQRLPLRIDEMNAVTCQGRHGVSDVFASALWALNAMFQSLAEGVDGVNIHTFPGTANQLFSFRRARARWSGRVSPEYYGLMMFARAAPPGSQLLELGVRDGAGIRAWATLAPDGHVRLVLINDSTSSARTVAVASARLAGSAQLVRLLAPSAAATAGITLGGQGFGSATTTGVPSGRLLTASLPAAGGRYTVSLPPASAAMLTFAVRAH